MSDDVTIPNPSSIRARTSTSSTTSSSHTRREADDIDARDANNPIMCTEYVVDMYAHMREKELASRINAAYMDGQPHINEKMRAILVDWLNEVHQKFRCVPETLYLTIYLMDRFLERETVERSRLQLVGVTALLVRGLHPPIHPLFPHLPPWYS